MTTKQYAAETAAFLQYLRDSRATRDLGDAIVDVLMRRASVVPIALRVDEPVPHRAAS